jgi:hypothetical protein
LPWTADTGDEINGRLKAGRLSHAKAAELLHNTFEEELSRSDPRIARGYWILKQLFEDFRHAIRGTRKQELKISPYKEFGRIEHLEENLGVIYDEIHSDEGTPRQRYLLLCLAHVIRFEVRAREVAHQLGKICWKAYPDDEAKKDQVIRDFLTLDNEGTDGKPDSEHLRNAVSHGRIRFTGRERILFEDRKSLGGPITYHREMDKAEFERFCDAFEIRLRLFPLYVVFHNVIVRLTRPHFAKRDQSGN